MKNSIEEYPGFQGKPFLNMYGCKNCSETFVAEEKRKIEVMQRHHKEICPYNSPVAPEPGFIDMHKNVYACQNCGSMTIVPQKCCSNCGQNQGKINLTPHSVMYYEDDLPVVEWEKALNPTRLT